MNPDTKKTLDSIMKNRFIAHPSASVYGGAAGLWDYGPLGSKILENIKQVWKYHFLEFTPNISEVKTSIINPEIIFKASGHLDKFSDLMVKDSVNGEPYRADRFINEALTHLKQKLIKKSLPKKASVEKLNVSQVSTVSPTQAKIDEIEADLSKLESMNAEETDALIEKYSIKSPNNNALSPASPFNLMFQVPLGPVGGQVGYLRPETAQGIFQNFQSLHRFHQQLPFGVVQIGPGFRNEINPRGGLIRLREFEMAELEFFVNKEAFEESFKAFKNSEQTFSSETLFRFWKSYSFCGSSTEKAVLEALNSTVGYKSGNGLSGTGSLFFLFENKIVQSPLVLFFLLQTLRFCESIGLKRERFRFRQHQENEMAHYASDCWDLEILSSAGWVECAGIADRGTFDLCRHAEHSKRDFTVGSKPVSVIEPSFGLSRIVYLLLENFLWVRGDSQGKRTVLSLPLNICPVRFVVIPLFPKDKLKEKAMAVFRSIWDLNKLSKIDLGSQNMGKKYARADEIGIKYTFTIDYESLENDSVTVRERDSCEQIRCKIEDIRDFVERVQSGLEWKDILEDENKFTKFG